MASGIIWHSENIPTWLAISSLMYLSGVIATSLFKFSPMNALILPFSLGLVVALCLYVFVTAARRRPSLPPGPNPLPFIGNIHQLPKVDQFLTYTKWANIYGPVVYFQVFGRKFVLLNTLKASMDLFEKRSNIYSTKPRLVMAGELVGRAQTSILFLPYGARLKECRRLVHGWINKNAVKTSFPTQELGSLKLAHALLNDPQNFSQHIRTQAGSVILKLTYGIDCAPVDDPSIAMAERLSQITAQATQPGRWMCDSFPSLVHIPSWFPGAYFQRWAAEARKVATELVRIPFERVRESLLNGSASPSWTASEIVDEHGYVKTADEAQDVLVAAGTMYSGGIDTTVGAVRTFFLMMARHPHIQQKAQEELDSVVGHDRLPSIEDRDSLPYLKLIIAEVLRYNPIAPIVPHSLDEDDIYENYLIPKGTWVMVNLWAILHDPNTYHSPEEFIPERYLGTKEYAAEPDPITFCFGFGRRACPGMHFALSTLFYNFAHVLHTFNIEPIKDANGHPRVPESRFVAGHLRAPSAFECSITPRNAQRASLVRDAIVSAGAE